MNLSPSLPSLPFHSPFFYYYYYYIIKHICANHLLHANEVTFGFVDGECPGEVFVDDGGHVARVVREHHAVGADVLRARPARPRRAPAQLALRLRRPAACNIQP